MSAFALALLPGGWELWVILAVIVLLFGNRIPGIARSLGSGIVEFKKGLRGEDDANSKQIGDSDAKKSKGDA
ncbi:MAG: twin-arginine translocase TatA/TatE family subunit [Planctomycetota bacterium]